MRPDLTFEWARSDRQFTNVAHVAEIAGAVTVVVSLLEEWQAWND